MSLVLPFAMASRPLQAVPDPGTEGLQVLTGDKGKLYVDLSRLQGEDGAGFSAGNAGLTDLKGVHTLVPVGSPLIREITVNSQLVKTFGAVGANGISIGATGGSLFNEDFEVFLNFQIEDGIPPSAQPLFGVTSTSPNSYFSAIIASTGKLLIRYRTTTEDSRWDSTSALLSDNVNNPHLLRIKYDFTTNTFGAWLDKTPIPGSFISGSITALNPANFTPDIDFVIGNNSTNGTLATNPVINSITGFAVTHLLTDQEADDVSDHMVDFGEVIPIGDAPTVQATNLRYSGRQTSIILNWDGGDGTNKIVIGKAAGAVTGTPTNGINYTANSIFGLGSEIGTDNFVVHNGIANTVTVTGLTRDTIYHFDVYEFNANGFQYLTTIDSNTIQARTAYIYDEDFVDYATDYTENQVEGFTSDVVAGELVLVGNPKGYQDWVQHNEWKTDLENFEIEILLRINDNLTEDTVGIGIGIKNDVDNEVNRGVVGVFVTAVGSNAFGKLQIYSGNGTSSPSAYAWRSESSTSFAPSNGSMYKVLFRRQAVGDNANYSIILTDVLDSEQPFMSTAWTEIGRPSSNFMATTTRAWIYQNGGNHAIDYFSVKRIDGTSPEEPIVADVYVSVSGNDSFDGLTPEQPKRTVVGGLNAIAALGGPVGSKVLSIGPGTYTETQLTPPNNLKLAYGASRESTIINAHDSLFSISSRSSMSGALLNFARSSSTTVDMVWRDMTLNGMSNGAVNSGNACKLGVSAHRCHGVKLRNIEIRHFNTCAVRLGEVDEFEMDGFVIHESSGSQGTSFTYYQIETWNIGTNTPLGNADGNFKIVIKNGLIRDQRLGGGAGWGMVGGAGGNSQPAGNQKYQCNIEFAYITFDVRTDSPDDDGHHFNIEALYFAVGNIHIHHCLFNSNISWGGLHGLATNLGKTRLSHNTFKLDDTNVSYVIEMQISDIEIDHNFVTGIIGARNGCFVILNTMSTFGNAGHGPVTRVPHGNWHMHHNIFECNSNGYVDGVGGALRWKVDGFVFEQNTIRFKTTSGTGWRGIILPNTSENAMTGLIAQNNIFMGQPASGSLMFNTNGFASGGICRYNFTSHLTINTRSGITNSNNQDGIGMSGLGLIGGSVPTTWEQAFEGNYYRPSSSSPIKNAGYQGVTPGALESL